MQAVQGVCVCVRGVICVREELSYGTEHKKTELINDETLTVTAGKWDHCERGRDKRSATVCENNLKQEAIYKPKGGDGGETGEVGSSVM